MRPQLRLPGPTEAKIPDIADAVVEITETGRALKAAGLRIVDTILTSYTELIAHPAACEDPEKRHAMNQLHTLLQGTLEARGKVLVKLNVPEADLRGVIDILPAMKSPTVSKLFGERGRARPPRPLGSECDHDWLVGPYRTPVRKEVSARLPGGTLSATVRPTKGGKSWRYCTESDWRDCCSASASALSYWF